MHLIPLNFQNPFVDLANASIESYFSWLENSPSLQMWAMRALEPSRAPECPAVFN